MVKKILFILILLSALQPSKAQQHGKEDTIRVLAYITPDGDTIPSGWMWPVEVRSVLSKKWKNYWADWTRLRNAVYVTYPYAKAASKTMNEVNAMLVNVNDKSKRRSIIHSREKDLKKQFADKLTQLSVYQGRVLMKLIYRETGSNCYEIIQEYKGGFNAAFWQSIAFIFGGSLKQNYDPADKDKAMESIVQDVEVMYGYRARS